MPDPIIPIARAAAGLADTDAQTPPLAAKTRHVTASFGRTRAGIPESAANVIDFPITAKALSLAHPGRDPQHPVTATIRSELFSCLIEMMEIDVSGFLAASPDESLRQMAANRWRDCKESREIADWNAVSGARDLRSMLDFACRNNRSSARRIDVCVEIDETQALSWIRYHQPLLYAAIIADTICINLDWYTAWNGAIIPALTIEECMSSAPYTDSKCTMDLHQKVLDLLKTHANAANILAWIPQTCPTRKPAPRSDAERILARFASACRDEAKTIKAGSAGAAETIEEWQLMAEYSSLLILRGWFS